MLRRGVTMLRRGVTMLMRGVTMLRRGVTLLRRAVTLHTVGATARACSTTVHSPATRHLRTRAELACSGAEPSAASGSSAPTSGDEGAAASSACVGASTAGVRRAARCLISAVSVTWLAQEGCQLCTHLVYGHPCLRAACLVMPTSFHILWPCYPMLVEVHAASSTTFLTKSRSPSFILSRSFVADDAESTRRFRSSRALRCSIRVAAPRRASEEAATQVVASQVSVRQGDV